MVNAKGKQKAQNGEGDQEEYVKKADAHIILTLLRFVFDIVAACGKFVLVCGSMMWAYRIRLHGLHAYGPVIHGFDPTFNFHAARYLAKHGWYKFFRWYDYMSWYPLGRPIGTTIYPGMQFFSVWAFHIMKKIPKATYKLPDIIKAYLPKYAIKYFPGHGTFEFGPMTLNNTCFMSGAWLGAVATFFIFLLTRECSGSTGAGVVAAFVMAGIPAHLMRSMAGEFDNEAFAMSAFTCTFWLWCRALRNESSWPYGILAGIAYAASVATWGGYIFVNNLIGLHAAVLVAAGMYNTGVYRAYSAWFIVGTGLATYVPVVNWTPIKSLEQMPSMCVFLGFQVLEACDVYRRRQKKPMSGMKFFMFRVMVFGVIGLVIAAVAYVLSEMGFFAPLSSRIRGIFMKHERTGNPLVDSVAEHQPTSHSAYEHYLGKAKGVAAVGIFFCWHQKTPAKFFPVIFAAVAYTFSLKMNRLIIICGPIVSMLAGYPIGITLDWCLEQYVRLVCGPRVVLAVAEAPLRTGGMASIFDFVKKYAFPQEFKDIFTFQRRVAMKLPFIDRPVRVLIASAILYAAYPKLLKERKEFMKFCEDRAVGFSGPGLMEEARLNNGQTVMIDDKLKGYEWLKKNTPADSRVLAWWDYGYQITGIGNRTSLADGNTWNHEHIATIGRILSGQEKKSHNIMRHLADYALVHAGQAETDLRISTHFARIGSSVFPDICGEEDPTCTKYGFVAGGQPSKMMAESFVYKAVKNDASQKAKLNSKLFQEVHSTKYGMIRIFKIMNVSQESKDWIADPANKVCDAPGSWYCVGQYPPALKKLIDKRKNFAQLEDFNKKGGEKSAYTKLIEKRQNQGDREL